MSYAVWLDGAKIGDSSLELAHGESRRAGVFHPTASGLAVLPGITAMAPALLDARRMCREAGIDTEDPDLDVEGATEVALGTPAGRRIRDAAKIIARLELRGPDGKCMPWESLLISDMRELAAIVNTRSLEGDPAADRAPSGDPVRYLISMKLVKPHRPGARLSHSIESH